MSPASLRLPWLLLLAACAPAHALQEIDASEQRTLAAKVPAHELTRIVVEGTRIRRYDAREGALEVKPAADRSSLQIIPLNERKPATLFLTTDSGHTYTLLLQPIDSPAGETVVLHEPPPPPPERPAPAPATAAPHEARILRLITAMARGEALDEAQIVRDSQELRLWRETRFTRTATYTLDDLSGEAYRLTNVSGSEMRVAEQELFAPGVAAVAVVQQTLAPGAATDVYVVRERP